MNNAFNNLCKVSNSRDEAAIKSLARERGLAEGARQNSIEIAKKMKQEGMNINIIVKITGISKEEIEKL